MWGKCRILDLTAVGLRDDRRIREQEAVKRFVKAVLNALDKHDLPTLAQDGSFQIVIDRIGLLQ